MLGMTKDMRQQIKMNNVFVNRTLNMKRITHIGLDMDHTLVRYKSKNFEELAHTVMCRKLVQDKAYPKQILDLRFDWKRAIRGLVIDQERGNILKISRYMAIRQSYHGLEPIPYRDQNRIYKSVYVDLGDPGIDKIETSFSISYANLYAQLVDLKDKHPDQYPDYKQLAADLNKVLDSAHRNDSLKGEVRKNLSHYIIKDRDIVKGMRRYKQHGKKIFIITNSDFNYSKLLLDYAINPFLKKNETWEDFFEFVIVDSRKPRFFYGKDQFEKIDTKTGKATLLEGPVVPGVYQHGNANKLTEDLGLDPHEILYIGDHIYGDIVRLKKECGWRTALVVEELDAEVAALEKAKVLEEKIEALMSKKVPLEKKIDELISESIETDGRKDNESKIEKLIIKSKEIDKKISPQIRSLQKLFNPYWGEVMRLGMEETYFSHHVERHACVYFARLSYLFDMSPRTYFRTYRRLMAHERGIRG